jgi:endonuclease/exonuclease/phosphatase family metal-dependent hydrolase
MLLMDWNIEWMNNWFEGGSQVAWRTAHGSIADVQGLALRVANVIDAVDPDVLTIQEGPSDIREMMLFVNGFLTDANGDPRFQSFQAVDGGAQKMYVLVKMGGAFHNAHVPQDPLTVSLTDQWQADTDGDMVLTGYDFTRTPLVVEGELDDGDTMRVVVVHSKSKYVHHGRTLWEDLARRQEYIVAALENRRRISSEAMRIRRHYLDALFEADDNSLVVVAGDFNDGQGVDYFEANYLTHGVADIMLGSVYYPHRRYHHALIGRVAPDDLYTAIFDDFVDGVDGRHLLLDHIIVSPGLADRHFEGTVEHDAFNEQIDNLRPAEARDRLPSDHRPISVTIQ